LVGQAAWVSNDPLEVAVAEAIQPVTDLRLKLDVM
jgi:hypothetical protein